MRTFTFEHEHGYSQRKPTVRVRLIGARLLTHVEITIDTGAEISVLNRQFAGAVGISIQSGRPGTLEVANGEVSPIWVHPIEIALLDRRLVVDVAICPEWDTPNLLGMEGFLDQMVVAFDHANRTIHF